MTQTRFPRGSASRHRMSRPSPTAPVLRHRNVDPPRVAPTNSGDCITCNSTGPSCQSRGNAANTTTCETATATSFQPVSSWQKSSACLRRHIPPIARQIRAQGAVSVQILVDEQGKVISAQAVSGNPMLTYVARDAAMRARFTPTLLSGTPVKVQGTIIYNFVLQ